MYSNFFDLEENPFALTPDPKFFYQGEVHSNTMKYLMFGIKNREGFIEIVGDPGTGKTLIGLTFLKQLDQKVHSVFFPTPPTCEIEILEMMINRLGLSPEAKERKDLIAAICEFARQEATQDRSIVLVFDEAQHITAELLEKIRLLTNITQDSRPIQVILIGQPELENNLRSKKLYQLYQRITIRSHLKPLTRPAVGEYIQFRLNQVRASMSITFSRKAVNFIFKYSQGYPRLVNLICDKSLMAASLTQVSHIDPALVKAAIKSSLAIDKPFSPTQPAAAAPRWAYATLIFVLFLLGGSLWRYQEIWDYWAQNDSIRNLQNTVGNIWEPKKDGKPSFVKRTN